MKTGYRSRRTQLKGADGLHVIDDWCLELPKGDAVARIYRVRDGPLDRPEKCPLERRIRRTIERPSGVTGNLVSGMCYFCTGLILLVLIGIISIAWVILGLLISSTRRRLNSAINLGIVLIILILAEMLLVYLTPRLCDTLCPGWWHAAYG